MIRTPHALVLGLGRFGGGVAAVRHLARHGFRVRVADTADPTTLRESLAAIDDLPRIETRFGKQDEALLDGIDRIVCNPAIPIDHPLLRAAEARGIPLTQEVNLFLEEYPGRVIAVTGTNGKSSTATLLANVLRACGVDTLLGGNIGHSLLTEYERWSKDQVAVLEISSFQLERVDPLRHRVHGTLFTAVTEDHLDRHGSRASYHAAKARAAAMADEFVAWPADDPVTRAMTHHAEVELRYGSSDYGRGDCPVAVQDDALVSRSGTDAGVVVCGAAMEMIGAFQLTNAAGALTAALATEPRRVDRHRAGLALALTEALPYRLQLKASIDGVRIFDNSVSTQVDSTLSALDGLRVDGDRVHWVGGGKSKDGRFEQPGARLSERVESAHLFGAAARELGRAMADRVQTTVHDDLDAALDAAYRVSREGDVILFSPAFASFDQFPNFAARAERFALWVDRIAGDRQILGLDGSHGRRVP